MTQSTERPYPLARTDAETQRLIDQARLWNDGTRHLLEAAGVGVGMKVLDVGTGAGDVALLAGQLVGPTGTVVGVDQNPASLATARDRARAAGLAHVTFVEGEFRDAALPDDFDAAVGRFVLMYAKDLAGAIRRIAGHVRPGGVLAFQEMDLSLAVAYTSAVPSLPLNRWLSELGRDLFGRLGLSPTAGSDLHRGFIDAGLGAPAMWLHAPLGGGPDWPGYRLSADSLRALVPLLEQFGLASAAELDPETWADRLRAEVETGGAPATVGVSVCAWARKA